jgi:RND family efflux transporter MFP subunit
LGFFLLALVLGTPALGFIACSHRSVGEDVAANSDAMVAEVTLTRVTRADISQTLTVSGTLAALPNQNVKVSSLVPGRIAELAVAEGDRVEAGQLLAKLDDLPLRDQLQQAEATADQARASLENARLALARNQNLFERGIAARKELEDARMLESVAAAALRQAEAALALARLQVSRTEIRSPLGGRVVKRFESVGEQVDGTAAYPIVEVANLNEVELFGNVPALYLPKMRIGRSLSVTTDVFPHAAFRGRVVAISPAVDPSTDVGLVRIRIANSSGLLRLGMFLTVQMPLETHTSALVVPPQAIYRDEHGSPHVYKVEGNVATAVAAQLGIETNDRVELLSGVREGDTVILTGGYGLGGKAKVEVKR